MKEKNYATKNHAMEERESYHTTSGMLCGMIIGLCVGASLRNAVRFAAIMIVVIAAFVFIEYMNDDK